MRKEPAMPTWFRTRTTESLGAAESAPSLDRWEPDSPYLTDGVDLYRYVGRVPKGTDELIVLEDCMSLKIVWFSLEELRGLRLRSVYPAADENEADAARTKR
jgi:hypothetical protein